MPNKLDHFAKQGTNDNASAPDDRSDRQARIRQLNDALRCRGRGRRVLVTASSAALPTEQQAAIVAAVAGFEEFDRGNDPHDEHDCALLVVDGRLIGFRIDYYGFDRLSHSPDPSDPATAIVMTIWMPDDA